MLRSSYTSFRRLNCNIIFTQFVQPSILNLSRRYYISSRYVPQIPAGAGVFWVHESCTGVSQRSQYAALRFSLQLLQAEWACRFSSLSLTLSLSCSFHGNKKQAQIQVHVALCRQSKCTAGETRSRAKMSNYGPRRAQHGGWWDSECVQASSCSTKLNVIIFSCSIFLHL